MRRALSRDRRNLGRPQGARLYRNSAPRSGLGTQRYAVLAGAAWWCSEFERRSDALADRECFVPHQQSRSARAGIIDVGLRTVPLAGPVAGPLGHRS